MVDTNTRQLPSGERIAVTAFIHSFLEPQAHHAIFKFRGVGAYEFRNLRVDSERLGWRTFSRALLEFNQYALVKRYGLLVDAHPGVHNSINARQEAVLGDMFLSQFLRGKVRDWERSNTPHEMIPVEPKNAME